MSAVDRSCGQLAREVVRTLPRYDPQTTACAIDLSDNVNLWGAPPAALRAITDAAPLRFSRYPSLYSEPLRAALLRYVGLEGANGVSVVTGCGSDDVLDAAIRAFGDAGDEIVFPAPTFAMIPIFARLNGLVVVPIPMNEQHGVDPERLVDRGAKVTYLCTPNNPTSTALARETVEYVAERAAGLVIIDEAYAEFAPETFVSLVAKHERLLVTRTFSKAFGLAGLRVGYGIGSESVVDLVTRARGPYKVNALAESAVIAALGEGDEALGWVTRHAGLAVEHRARFAAELRGLGFAPLPSAANFVFVPTARARALAAAMSSRGVLVRALSDLPRGVAVFDASEGQALRIGVGPWETMERALETLREVLPCA